MQNTSIRRAGPYPASQAAQVRVEVRQSEANGFHAGYALFVAAALAFAFSIQVSLLGERAQGLVLNLAVPAVLVLSLSLLGIPALRTSLLKSKEDAQ